MSDSRISLGQKLVDSENPYIKDEKVLFDYGPLANYSMISYSLLLIIGLTMSE